jgi:CheY-like chemotaxis protein
MILVVDDDADTAECMSLVLRMEGYRTATACDGHAALDRYASTRPDAALLDLGLPDIDGCELARRIRAGADDPRLLLVALTGSGDDAHRSATRAAGFDAHLLKPVAPGEILQLLARHGLVPVPA